MYFAGKDVSKLWDDSNDSRFLYMCSPPTAEGISELETTLGYQLPASYLWLIRQHNGGAIHRHVFPTGEPTGWAIDHIAVGAILGTGKEVAAKEDHPEYGSAISVWSTSFVTRFRKYPPIGLMIADPVASEAEIFLDYRECGPTGEPKVVYVDSDRHFHITPLADSFEEFICGLIPEEDFIGEQPEIELKEGPPDDPLGIVYYWQEKGAYRNLIDVIKTFPPEDRTDEVELHLADAYIKAGFYKKAVSVLEEQRERLCYNPLYHYHLGQALCFFAIEKACSRRQRMRCLYQAEQAFLRVVDMEPHSRLAEDSQEFLILIRQKCT